MNTEFWWFFDAVAVVILLVTVFLSGKRGFSKSIVTCIGCIVAVALSFPLSRQMGEIFYNSSISESNVKALDKALEKNSVPDKMKTYIEGLGYSIRIDEDIFVDILTNEEKDVYDALYTYVNNINGRNVDEKSEFEEKLTEGFALTIGSIVKQELTAYEAEYAENFIRTEEGRALLEENMYKVCNPNTTVGAEYIEANFVATGSKEFVRVMSFVILVFVIMIIVKIVEKLIHGEENPDRINNELASHIAGGVLGIFEGLMLIFVASACVRVNIILGSDNMMMFNSETIDKTIVFKYVYNLVLKI